MNLLTAIGVLALTVIGFLVLVAATGVLAGLAWWLFLTGWNIAP